jgi:hypothetical protein
MHSFCFFQPPKEEVLISSNDRKQHSVGFYEGGAFKPQAYFCGDDDAILIPPPLGNTNLMDKVCISCENEANFSLHYTLVDCLF